ncbi:hypothetical protein [Sporosalibacterium faouarense]|uniref:hypothetical protein n=1 Tax=Sporosalibacterium faouarense TaxID=516123 RepID=UPI00141D7003|nr:hypothetical protein [Sporosalibacterium faouarense]MTI46446.1 hypothetical protein [Bacillota bacterium]
MDNFKKINRGDLALFSFDTKSGNQLIFSLNLSDANDNIDIASVIKNEDIIEVREYIENRLNKLYYKRNVDKNEELEEIKVKDLKSEELIEFALKLFEMISE